MNELELHFSNANTRYGNAKSYKRNSSKEINASLFKYAKVRRRETIDDYKLGRYNTTVRLYSTSC